MPPAKARPHETDARSETSARGKHSSHARIRKTGGPGSLPSGSLLKEVHSAAVNAASAASRNGGQSVNTGSTGGISWVSEDLGLLQSYRSSHRLDVPSAFKNPMGHIILGSGIGRYSPTMARKRSERRIPKEQLATAVRKNFNGLAVSESEVIVDFLYKVKMQDKAFRLRFPPPRAR